MSTEAVVRAVIEAQAEASLEAARQAAERAVYSKDDVRYKALVERERAETFVRALERAGYTVCAR